MSRNPIDKDVATERLTSSNRPVRSAVAGSAVLEVVEDPTENLAAPSDALEIDTTKCIRPPGSPALHLRQRVDGYEILDELGRGGMGVVYKAWQHSLQRHVALKMILAGSFAGSQDLDRFHAEAMAIARLHHPHLVSIYGIGETNHWPFYAMEYMEGGSLARRLNGQPLKARVAATLLRSLAQAMDYAHKNGIVHRDLKPANILLSGDQNTPLEACIAKITDFGIAKHLNDDSNYTRTGDILGTPHYMAPEQATGRSGLIGPAADVYSLGAILYELLTGRPPFHGHDGAAVLVKLAREEPERPTHWVRSLPRDLETICLKCLEKDPAKRYVSAAALADDLTRFLQNETIRAKPATLLDRGVKWTRRRPAHAAVLAMTIGAAVLAFGMMAMMWRQAVDNAGEQEKLLTKSKALLADAFLDRGIHLAENGDVRRGMHWMLRSLEITEEIERRQQGPSALASVIRMNLASWGQCVGAREMLLPHSDWVWDAAFTRDGRFVATASKDQRVQIWNVQTGQPAGDAIEHPFPVWALAFHPDGKTFFTVCGDDLGHAGWLCVWSAHPDKPGQFLPRGAPLMFPYELSRMQLNAQGDRMWLASSRTGMACLLAFDPAAAGNGLSLVASMDGCHPLAVFRSDGAALATLVATMDDGKGTALPARPTSFVQLWNARTGQPDGAPLEHPGPTRALAFSRDGRHLIVGCNTEESLEKGESSRVTVWDLAKRARVSESPPLLGRVKTITTAPNGDLFAVSLFDYVRTKSNPQFMQVTGGHVALWQLHENGDIETYGTPLRTNHVVWSMEFSPDSRMLLTGCENSGAILWSVSNCQQLMPAIWHEGNSVKVAFSPSGRHAVTGSAGGANFAAARLWEVPSFAHIGLSLAQPAGIRTTYWEQDGKRLWVNCGRAHCQWDPIRGVKTKEVPMPTYSYWSHRTKEDHRFFADPGDGRLREFNLAAGTFTKVPFLADRPGIKNSAVNYSANTEIFIEWWTNPCQFQLWNRDGTSRSRLVSEPDYELNLREVSPNADYVAVAQSIRRRAARLVLYDANDDFRVKHVIPLQHTVSAMAFSRDGQTLSFGGADRQIQSVNVETGKPVSAPILHEGIVHWASYLHSDRLLATSSEKGLIMVWDMPSGKRVGPAFEHRADLMSIAVHPEGKYILTGTTGKMAMTWRTPEPMAGSLEHIRLWVEAMTAMEMREQDTIVPIETERLLEKRRSLQAPP